MTDSHKGIKILFVCHGNICRSTMAEFVMKKLVDDAGLEDMIKVESAATSTEEIGNDTHPGTKRMLDVHGIPYSKRRARQIKRSDYDDFDFIVGMDRQNMSNMRRAFGGDPQEKLSLMMQWAGYDRDVADPWYTGDFETTYEDVEAGCISLLEHIKRACNLESRR